MDDQAKTKEQLIAELAGLRQNLNALVNHLPEGFFIVDAPDLKIRVASHDSHMMLGVRPEELEGVQSEGHFKFYQVFRPDGTTPEAKELPLRRAADNGEVIRNEEWLFQTADGRKFPILCHAGPVLDEHGAIRGAVISWQDLSDRKQAEEALRQSENRFRSLFQDSSVGTVVVTPDGQFLQVNRAFCELIGYSESELIGQSLLAFTHADDREASARAYAEAVELGPCIRHHEKRYLHRNGQVVWGEVNANLIYDTDGKPSYLIAQILDITERKKAEESLRKARDELEQHVQERTAELAAANEQLHREIEDRKQIEVALRQSEEMYRALIEACPDPVFLVDLNEIIVFASERTADMFGYGSGKDLCGKKATDLIIEEERPRMIAGLPLLLKERVRRQQEYVGLRKDGSHFIGEVSSALLCDDHGTPTGFMAVPRDITQRKQIEDALERERQSLWRMLQASDHERQTISYEIHDGLAQYLAAALMQFQTNDSVRQNFPGKAKKAYEIGVELVRQAHAESRRLISEVRPPVIDDSGLETAISHLVFEQRRINAIEILYSSNVRFGRLPAIMENTLYRIVQEALANACKHSESQKVEVTLTQEGQFIQLAVRDWGVGFDLNAVEEGHFGVEGIRQRARLLGGRLTIESKSSSGTLIQVVVPILESRNQDNADE
jgi:PAS domain S-box-containing protein